jgi:hypothetical protein
MGVRRTCFSGRHLSTGERIISDLSKLPFHPTSVRVSPEDSNSADNLGDVIWRASSRVERPMAIRPVRLLGALRFPSSRNQRRPHSQSVAM